MTEMLIESVVMAFMIGGIVGAAVALSLKSSRFWGRRLADDTAELDQARVRVTRQRYHR